MKLTNEQFEAGHEYIEALVEYTCAINDHLDSNTINALYARVKTKIEKARALLVQDEAVELNELSGIPVDFKRWLNAAGLDVYDKSKYMIIPFEWSDEIKSEVTKEYLSRDEGNHAADIVRAITKVFADKKD